jgi:hypothetical protein
MLYGVLSVYFIVGFISNSEKISFDVNPFSSNEKPKVKSFYSKLKEGESSANKSIASLTS